MCSKSPKQIPAIVDHGTIPAATTAQAFHAPASDVSDETAAIAAATPSTTAAAAIPAATTVMARGQQLLAACATVLLKTLLTYP